MQTPQASQGTATAASAAPAPVCQVCQGDVFLDTCQPAPLLSAQGIRKRFADEWILDGASLELHTGQSVALMSPSGTGKSTLLSILGLLMQKTEGSLTLQGRDTDALSPRERARVRQLTFGFIFQHTQLIGSLRAIENVLVPASFTQPQDRAHLKKISGDLPQRAEELLTALGLEHRLYHYPHQLSVGQKRRVAVARALLLDPPILLADEPTNDLDTTSAQTVAQTLLACTQEGRALIFATHDHTLAHQATSILTLQDGTLIPTTATALKQ
ncbi:MAG: ABC transporter ATP-binding protein [Coriobacteriales bacterium]|nr:ABC transporter ATP-binding protein [Coriobacteriales bacterium]